MKKETKVWTPPTPEDHSLKMECLKRSIDAVSPTVSQRTAEKVLEDAKVLYGWFVKEGDAS